jgi:site-specific DNA-methyltransferase (adenine-specific)
MTISEALFSSEKSDWQTPPELFQSLNERYGPYVVDAAASHSNALCDYYYTESGLYRKTGDSPKKITEEDGLSGAWEGRVFCNPPYGRSIGKWVQKGLEEWLRQADLVTLPLPSRTDTKWFQDYILPMYKTGYADVEFIRGRLKFSGAKDAAPFPSITVTYRVP